MHVLHSGPSNPPNAAWQTGIWTSESNAHDSATVAAKQEDIVSVDHWGEG